MAKRKRKQGQEEVLPVPAVPKRIQPLVETWAQEACEMYNVQLFDVIVSKGWLIRIYVDSEIGAAPGKGVEVVSCVNVSRYVEALLDEEEGVYEGYNIEVSSPGIERKLTKAKHYAMSVGKTARIIVKEAIEGETVFNGTIDKFEDNKIEVTTEKGSVSIPFGTVTKAKLTFQF